MATRTTASHEATGPGAFPLGRWTGAWLVVTALVVGLLAFTQLDKRKAMIEKHIDCEWFRRSLAEDNLAHWLAAAPTENGFLRSALDRRWRPAKEQSGTLVSQSRLLFVLAAGYEVTGEPAYLDAVRRGGEFLLEHFHDDEHGGWFWSVSPEGRTRDTAKNAYGHAFVLFGLAHAARVTGEQRFADAALETWEVVKQRLFDEQGGMKPGTSRDWKHKRGGNSQNPMMHLFEALLAVHDATGSETVFNDTLALAEFIFTRLYQEEGGYLPEMYDADWRPLEAPPGYVDLGHQFEWAFLLSRAVQKGFPQKYLFIGRRLLDFGMKHAYDAENGGIFNASDYDGRVRGTGKDWWQQTEHLRALMRYAADHGREDLWEKFDKSLAFVKDNFIDHEYGGWYGSYGPGRRGGKGSVWKVGYHTAGMYLEALRLCESVR